MVCCVGNGHGQATGRLCEDRALGIVDACREAGVPEPRLQFDARDVWVEFPFPSEYLAIVPAASEARDGVTKPESRPESRPESLGPCATCNHVETCGDDILRVPSAASGARLGCPPRISNT
jgi:hypothetical protein